MKAEKFRGLIDGGFDGSGGVPSDQRADVVEMSELTDQIGEHDEG